MTERIGQAVARRARGFSLRVLYGDTPPAPAGVEREPGLAYFAAGDLPREADFVSLHAPLLPSTRCLTGAAQLALMKPAAILANTARGPAVDEAAPVEALAAGVIAAAGLDVFETEPEAHPGPLGSPNAAPAPHIASASIDTRRPGGRQWPRKTPWPLCRGGALPISSIRACGIRRLLAQEPENEQIRGLEIGYRQVGEILIRFNDMIADQRT